MSEAETRAEHIDPALRAATPGAWMPQQFENAANVAVHVRTTVREIAADFPDEGTNTVVGTDPAKIIAAARNVLAGGGKQGRRPALWDGHAAERTVDELVRLLAALPATGNPVGHI